MAVIGIVGTAGRKEDKDRLDRTAYDLMYARALRAVSDWSPATAVSGGAAYADHLAVRAFLEGEVGGLTLYLPCAMAGRRFVDAGDGRTANLYHDWFSAKCGVDSFGEIAKAVEKGAGIVVVPAGFKARNLRIGADASHLLAFTFGTADATSTDFAGTVGSRAAGLKPGGSSHCWQNAQAAVRRHVDLGIMLDYRRGADADLFSPPSP